METQKIVSIHYGSIFGTSVPRFCPNLLFNRVSLNNKRQFKFYKTDLSFSLLDKEVVIKIIRLLNFN